MNRPSPSNSSAFAISSAAAAVRPDPLGMSDSESLQQNVPAAASSSAGPVSGLADFGAISPAQTTSTSPPSPAISSSAGAIRL